MTLVRRVTDTASNTAGKYSFNKAFPSGSKEKIGGNPTATETYNNWNDGRCHSASCRYRHTCKTCNEAHPATEHTGTAATGTTANSVPLSLRVGNTRPLA